MLALFRKFVRWLRPDGVRALKQPILLDLYSRQAIDVAWQLEFFSWPTGTRFEISSGALQVSDVRLGGPGCDWMIK